MLPRSLIQSLMEWKPLVDTPRITRLRLPTPPLLLYYRVSGTTSLIGINNSARGQRRPRPPTSSISQSNYLRTCFNLTGMFHIFCAYFERALVEYPRRRQLVNISQVRSHLVGYCIPGPDGWREVDGANPLSQIEFHFSERYDA